MSHSMQGDGTPQGRRWTEAGFVFALFCMVVAGGFSFYNLRRLTADTAWVEHTYQVMQSLDNFLWCFTSAETAQRGFNITGDEAYADSLERNIEITRRAAAQLLQMTRDNPEQQNRLSSLAPLLSQRFAALEDMVAARRANADLAQLRRISEGGLTIANGIHALIGNLYASQQDLLRVRSRRAADSANAAHWVILGCSALGCLFVALSLMAIRRDLLGRNAAERRLRESNESLEARVSQRTAELRVAYEELRQSQQSALQRERLRALGQMASGIAHDINNALSPVSLYLEAIGDRERSLTPESVAELEVIRRGIDDVARTVTRIRDFSRQRDQSLGLAPTDLNELVRQVSELTRARWIDMSQRGGVVIDFKNRLDPGLPPVMGIEGEIRDALINLIFNAADAMPRGGALVVRSAVIGRFVGLEVLDQGIGMDEDTRRRCLEPFFTTKGERGTGLGLAMVYGTMQRHRGDIEIESTPGQGTTLRLLFEPAAAASLPAKIPGADRVVGTLAFGACKVAAAPGAFRVPPMRVLVVDDDPLILTALRLTLESDGHEVTVAIGGAAGVAAFRAAQADLKSFAVVMTDLGMPHVDGRQVAAAIKAVAPETGVLLLTGWAERFVASSDIPAHVDLVLGKPPKRAALREALHQLLTPPAAAVNL